MNQLPRPTPNATFFFAEMRIETLGERDMSARNNRCIVSLTISWILQVLSRILSLSNIRGYESDKLNLELVSQMQLSKQRGFARKSVMPTDLHNAQIEKYRNMSGHDRLLVGLRLHELSCEIAREGIRAMQPKASDEDIAKELRRRLRLAYQIGERAVAR